MQEAVSAKHFVRKCTEELIGYPSLGKDAEASLLVQRIQDLAEKHVGRIETLPSRIDEQPSALREKLIAGLGATLGWMEWRSFPTAT